MSFVVPYILFGIQGWDGQVGQRFVLRDTMGWTGGTEICVEGHYEISLDVSWSLFGTEGRD